jgi:dTDP-glucose pyrophosphorylase
VKAVLLAGGLGTRMREETEYRPKPMVEIGGQPILWHIMRNLAQHGVRLLTRTSSPTEIGIPSRILMEAPSVFEGQATSRIGM